MDPQKDKYNASFSSEGDPATAIRYYHVGRKYLRMLLQSMERSGLKQRTRTYNPYPGVEITVFVSGSQRHIHVKAGGAAPRFNWRGCPYHGKVVNGNVLYVWDGSTRSYPYPYSPETQIIVPPGSDQANLELSRTPVEQAWDLENHFKWFAGSMYAGDDDAQICGVPMYNGTVFFPARGVSVNGLVWDYAGKPYFVNLKVWDRTAPHAKIEVVRPFGAEVNPAFWADTYFNQINPALYPPINRVILDVDLPATTSGDTSSYYFDTEDIIMSPDGRKWSLLVYKNFGLANWRPAVSMIAIYTFTFSGIEDDGGITVTAELEYQGDQLYNEQSETTVHTPATTAGCYYNNDYSHQDFSGNCLAGPVTLGFRHYESGVFDIRSDGHPDLAFSVGGWGPFEDVVRDTVVTINAYYDRDGTLKLVQQQDLVNDAKGMASASITGEAVIYAHCEWAITDVNTCDKTVVTSESDFHANYTLNWTSYNEIDHTSKLIIGGVVKATHVYPQMYIRKAFTETSSEVDTYTCIYAFSFDGERLLGTQFAGDLNANQIRTYTITEYSPGSGYHDPETSTSSGPSCCISNYPIVSVTDYGGVGSRTEAWPRCIPVFIRDYPHPTTYTYYYPDGTVSYPYTSYKNQSWNWLLKRVEFAPLGLGVCAV